MTYIITNKHAIRSKLYYTALSIPGLDVIKYSEWPILEEFSWELPDNALFVAVGFQLYSDNQMSRFAHRAMLHDRRKKTYLHELYPEYNVSK